MPMLNVRLASFSRASGSSFICVCALCIFSSGQKAHALAEKWSLPLIKHEHCLSARKGEWWVRLRELYNLSLKGHQDFVFSPRTCQVQLSLRPNRNMLQVIWGRSWAGLADSWSWEKWREAFVPLQSCCRYWLCLSISDHPPPQTPTQDWQGLTAGNEALL